MFWNYNFLIHFDWYVYVCIYIHVYKHMYIYACVCIYIYISLQQHWWLGAATSLQSTIHVPAYNPLITMVSPLYRWTPNLGDNPSIIRIWTAQVIFQKKKFCMWVDLYSTNSCFNSQLYITLSFPFYMIWVHSL